MLQQTTRAQFRRQPFKPAAAPAGCKSAVRPLKQQRIVVVRANPFEDAINSLTVALKNSPINEGTHMSVLWLQT